MLDHFNIQCTESRNDEKALGIGRADETEGLGNGSQQVRIVSGFGLAQVGFDFDHIIRWD